MQTDKHRIEWNDYCLQILSFHLIDRCANAILRRQPICCSRIFAFDYIFAYLRRKDDTSSRNGLELTIFLLEEVHTLQLFFG